MWTQEHEHVWKAGGCEAHVYLRILGPRILQIDSISSPYWKPWSIGGVEASGTDDDVKLELAVTAFATYGRKFCDTTWHYCDILALKAL